MKYSKIWIKGILYGKIGQNGICSSLLQISPKKESKEIYFVIFWALYKLIQNLEIYTIFWDLFKWKWKIENN
jgi:hypothetical protein